MSHTSEPKDNFDIGTNKSAAGNTPIVKTESFDLTGLLLDYLSHWGVFLLSIIREGYTARCQHVLQRSQRVRGEPQTSLCLLLLVELRGRLHLPLHALQELQQLFRMVARIFQTTFKTIKISHRNNPP